MSPWRKFGNFQSMQLLWFVWSALLIFQSAGEACPLVCICKWKGGKQTVSCRSQGLQTIPAGIDPETQVLDISGNNLGVLPRDAFKDAGLLNLQKIHVSNCKISQIDPQAFAELINLVELDLSDNQLSAIPSMAFRSTGYVRDLNLAGNPIQYLQNGAFLSLPHLIKLDLSRCQINRMEDQAFANLMKLETLKLNTNFISDFSNITIRYFQQSNLSSVELQDNPWHCDCKLLELKIWLESKNPVSPTCHSPERISGRKFSDLPLTEFACLPRVVYPIGRKGITIYEQEDATLDCVYESVPTPSVQWFFYKRPITNNTVLSQKRKFVIFERPQRSTLTLTSAELKDGGDFFCILETPAGTAQGNFSLDVFPPGTPLPTNDEDDSSILILILAVALVICILAIGLGLFLWAKFRLTNDKEDSVHSSTRKASPGRSVVHSTPVKAGRNNFDYEINPGSLLTENGFKPHPPPRPGFGRENPDIIQMSSTTVGGYPHPQQELPPYTEDGSLASELNWEGGSLSFRNLGYTAEYPPDYGLPIIPEASIYSESTYGVNNLSAGRSDNPNPDLPLSHSSSTVMSAVWNKGSVAARIASPGARDSPDEGYQEGFVATDV